jgi:molybdopterin synthase catalytic subunit
LAFEGTIPQAQHSQVVGIDTDYLVEPGIERTTREIEKEILRKHVLACFIHTAGKMKIGT